MAIVAVSISPVGEGVSVSSYVAEALRVLDAQQRVRWRPDPRCAALGGDPEEIWRLIRAMQEAVFSAGAVRVGTVIKMDERRDREVGLDDKVETALEKLKGR